VTAPDEQRLVSDLRAGRPEACAELVRAHYQAVYRFLAQLTRDVHRAEDLTQETFAAAWQKIATFQGRSTLATWLHRIAYTKFIDDRRAEQRAAGACERRTGLAAAPAGPLDAAAADDEARRLYRALDELDAPERALLVLHYLQGLSYREMASVLSEPTGTVKWRTAEALNRLRALLGDEVPDHAPRTTSEPGPLF
jgi:RNA polymerase sigma-70 factor (ECF subfamily)